MSILDAPPRPYATHGGAALAAAPARRPTARPAPEAQPRHLRVVGPAERVRRRLTPATGVLLTGLLFVTLFAIAVAHTLLVQGQIRLDALDAQLTTEQARYQALRKEVAEAESPARVVDAAQALGMVAPDDLVYLQPDDAEISASSDAASSSNPPGRGEGPTSRAGTDGEVRAVDAPSGWSTMKPLLDTPAP